VPARRARRAVTLPELAVAFVVVGILFALSVPAVRVLRSDVGEEATFATLATAQVELRRVAGLPGNHYRYPEVMVVDGDEVPFLELLSLRDASFTAGPSSGPAELSVHRVDDRTVVVAARAGSGACLVLVDSTAAQAR
jgi:hypothetical protein